LGAAKTEIFLKEGLDSQAAKQPAGQITGRVVLANAGNCYVGSGWR
jgi:hypothetical protein